MSKNEGGTFARPAIPSSALLNQGKTGDGVTPMSFLWNRPELRNETETAYTMIGSWENSLSPFSLSNEHIFELLTAE